MERYDPIGYSVANMDSKLALKLGSDTLTSGSTCRLTLVDGRETYWMRASTRSQTESYSGHHHPTSVTSLFNPDHTTRRPLSDIHPDRTCVHGHY
jgi:hypothetical protein